MKRPISKDDWNKRCVFLPEVDSTNRYALDLVRLQRPADGTVIHTGYQSQGRGQRGRNWVANPDVNALFSTIYYPSHIHPAQHFLLNKLVSLALWSAIKPLIGDSSLQIKWPNDLYLNRKKMGGILIQNVLKGKTIDHCIVGIGLNVNQKAFSDDLPSATSMLKELKQSFDVITIIQKVVVELDCWLNKTTVDNLDSLYVDHLYLKDEEATFFEGERMFRGMIRGVDHMGQLLIEEEGQLKSYSFGEIKYG